MFFLIASDALLFREIIQPSVYGTSDVVAIRQENNRRDIEESDIVIRQNDVNSNHSLERAQNLDGVQNNRCIIFKECIYVMVALAIFYGVIIFIDKSKS